MNNSFLLYFSEMKDPRVDRAKRHLLNDILFITIAAVLSGADTWNDIADYGKSKIDWLSTVLELPEGIPSHDTFNRVFALIDAEEFEKIFIKWIKSIQQFPDNEFVSIDGKTLRGSRVTGSKEVTHIVSAWANKNNLILGQIKVDEKSNEITAIPKLLDMLMIKGTTITIDAMGTQTKIARKIVSKGADYILAVKGNQGELFDDIKDSFKVVDITDTHNDTDYGHGRIETRKCNIITDLSLVPSAIKWKAIKSIVHIKRTRYFKATGKEEKEDSYYISTHDNAEVIANGIRKHWGIENKVHWVLDVIFNEDNSRKRAGNAAKNFTNVNRIALNILRADDRNISIRRKRNLAGWENDYMEKLLKI
jgi:predicted transposase YbfD/YdcC